MAAPPHSFEALDGFSVCDGGEQAAQQDVMALHSVNRPPPEKRSAGRPKKAQSVPITKLPPAQQLYVSLEQPSDSGGMAVTVAAAAAAAGSAAPEGQPEKKPLQQPEEAPPLDTRRLIGPILEFRICVGSGDAASSSLFIRVASVGWCLLRSPAPTYTGQWASTTLCVEMCCRMCQLVKKGDGSSSSGGGGGGGGGSDMTFIKSAAAICAAPYYTNSATGGGSGGGGGVEVRLSKSDASNAAPAILAAVLSSSPLPGGNFCNTKWYKSTQVFVSGMRKDAESSAGGVGAEGTGAEAGGGGGGGGGCPAKDVASPPSSAEPEPRQVRLSITPGPATAPTAPASRSAPAQQGSLSSFFRAAVQPAATAAGTLIGRGSSKERGSTSTAAGTLITVGQPEFETTTTTTTAAGTLISTPPAQCDGAVVLEVPGMDKRSMDVDDAAVADQKGEGEEGEKGEDDDDGDAAAEKGVDSLPVDETENIQVDSDLGVSPPLTPADGFCCALTAAQFSAAVSGHTILCILRLLGSSSHQQQQQQTELQRREEAPSIAEVCQAVAGCPTAACNTFGVLCDALLHGGGGCRASFSSSSTSSSSAPGSSVSLDRAPVVQPEDDEVLRAVSDSSWYEMIRGHCMLEPGALLTAPNLLRQMSDTDFWQIGCDQRAQLLLILVDLVTAQESFADFVGQVSCSEFFPEKEQLTSLLQGEWLGSDRHGNRYTLVAGSVLTVEPPPQVELMLQTAEQATLVEAAVANFCCKVFEDPAQFRPHLGDHQLTSCSAAALADIRGSDAESCLPVPWVHNRQTTSKLLDSFLDGSVCELHLRAGLEANVAALNRGFEAMEKPVQLVKWLPFVSSAVSGLRDRMLAVSSRCSFTSEGERSAWEQSLRDVSEPTADSRTSVCDMLGLLAMLESYFDGESVDAAWRSSEPQADEPDSERQLLTEPAPRAAVLGPLHCIACAGLQPVKLYNATHNAQFVCLAAHHRALSKTSSGHVVHGSDVFVDDGNFVLMKGARMQEPKVDFLNTQSLLECWPRPSVAGEAGRHYVAAMQVALTLKNVAMASHQRLSSKSNDDYSSKPKRQRIASVKAPLCEMLASIKQQVQCCASRRHQWRADILSAISLSNLERCVAHLEAVTVAAAKRPSAATVVVNDIIVPFDNKAVSEIICQLMLDKNANPFLKNISRRHFPDYRKIVPAPMSLCTMRTKADCDAYRTLEEVSDDLGLLKANTTRFCAVRFPHMVGACTSLCRSADRLLEAMDSNRKPERSKSTTKSLIKPKILKRKKHPMMCVCEDCI